MTKSVAHHIIAFDFTNQLWPLVAHNMSVFFITKINLTFEEQKMSQ